VVDASFRSVPRKDIQPQREHVYVEDKLVWVDIPEKNYRGNLPTFQS